MNDVVEITPASQLGDGKLDVADIGKLAAFWKKYNKQIWSVILIIVGALGGNADRLAGAVSTVPDYLPTSKSFSELSDKVDNLSERVDNLEKLDSRKESGRIVIEDDRL